jgi:hypothetical protein
MSQTEAMESVVRQILATANEAGGDRVLVHRKYMGQLRDALRAPPAEATPPSSNLDLTPRTDANATDGWSGDAVAVPVEFAQSMERAATRLHALLCRTLDDYRGALPDPERTEVTPDTRHRLMHIKDRMREADALLTSATAEQTRVFQVSEVAHAFDVPVSLIAAEVPPRTSNLVSVLRRVLSDYTDLLNALPADDQTAQQVAEVCACREQLAALQVETQAPRARDYTGVGELERTGYIPAGSAEERELAPSEAASFDRAFATSPRRIETSAVPPRALIERLHGFVEKTTDPMGYNRALWAIEEALDSPPKAP